MASASRAGYFSRKKASSVNELFRIGVACALFWAFPIYTEERDLERREGVEVLVKLFQKHKIASTIQIGRKNVAKPSGN